MCPGLTAVRVTSSTCACLFERIVTVLQETKPLHTLKLRGPDIAYLELAASLFRGLAAVQWWLVATPVDLTDRRAL